MCLQRFRVWKEVDLITIKSRFGYICIWHSLELHKAQYWNRFTTEEKKSREIKWLAQSPTISKYLNQDLSSSLFAEPMGRLQCQDASQGTLGSREVRADGKKKGGESRLPLRDHRNAFPEIQGSEWGSFQITAIKKTESLQVPLTWVSIASRAWQGWPLPCMAAGIINEWDEVKNLLMSVNCFVKNANFIKAFKFTQNITHN